MNTKFTLILLSIFCLFSCSSDDDSNTNETTEVNIRLSNTSDFKFENATYNNVNFGDIEPGEITEYKTFESSYSYGRVIITIEGQEYAKTPIDFVGESLLEAGNYTFHYSFENNNLTDELVKDWTFIDNAYKKKKILLTSSLITSIALFGQTET